MADNLPPSCAVVTKSGNPWNPLGPSGPVTGLLYICFIRKVAQLAESLRYKPEGRGVDTLWCYWNCGPGVDSASNRNEYQKYFLRGKGGRCVGLTSQSSCADCLEIWEPQPPGTLRVCPGLLQGLLYLCFKR